MGATSPTLVAAVSNVGGRSVLALGWSTPGAVRGEIRATKALTQRPFRVNLEKLVSLVGSQSEAAALFRTPNRCYPNATVTLSTRRTCGGHRLIAAETARR